jgi:pimeloyl-ACP methyl ester carboxylesterase
MVEKIYFKNSRGLQLAGSLWPALSNAIVIMAHGSGSNRFARGLFESLALALQKENYNVLAFDFSGHGESSNDIVTIKKAVDDVSSALRFSHERGFKRVAMIGHSLGALACLEAFSPGIETMILLGALTGPVRWKWEEMASPEQVREMHQKGYITAEVDDGLRKTVIIDANLLKEIAAIDQEKC